MKVGEFTLKKCVGKGAFGEVFLATKEGSKELYAAKRLNRENSEKPKNMKRLSNEINILKVVEHPNIIKVFDLKKTENYFYIITEYCNGGSLSYCLMKYIKLYQKPFSEEIVQYLMRQIVDAIYYLHYFYSEKKKKIIHRDLKLDNILVTFLNNEDLNSLNMMKAVVKIIDFGFARTLDPSNGNKAHTVLGTDNYMEPKLLQNMETNTQNIEGYDEKADIWSLGALCHEMLVGHMTFSGKNKEELYQKVREGTYSFPLNSSKEAVSFVNGMLQSDPNRRLSAAELLNHNFLVKDVKKFEPIDLDKVQGKISGDQMNINYINNRTIWSIFNQDNNSQNNPNNNNNINNNENIINQQSKQQFIQKQYIHQNRPNKQMAQQQQHNYHQHQYVSASVPPLSFSNQNKILFQGSQQMQQGINKVPFSSQVVYGNSPQFPLE